MKAPWESKGEITRPVPLAVLTLAKTLFERIARGGYPYGSRLPAERQLADEFGLSRATVRKALDVMEAYDLVGRRQGSGSFVIFQAPEGPPTPSDAAAAARVNAHGTVIKLQEIAEITSPLELNVVRSILEPETARLAVINMSARDIARLKQSLEKIQAVRTSAEDFSHWDRAFHLQIARGTHNPLLIGIYDLIDHVRRHAHWARTEEKTLSPSRIREHQAKYRAIFEAIEARDIESAVEFSKIHMTEVQRDLMQDN